MAGIKVVDMAYARLRAPDLDAMEAFLLDFGLLRAARTERALYMRGTDAAHHLHITEKGDPKFVGFAFWAESEADLRRLAECPDAGAVEPIDEPGGGLRVRLTDPNGYQVEVVHGIERVAEIALPGRQPSNSHAAPQGRVNVLLRLEPGPSRVKRIGHGVLCTPDMPKTLAWYRDRLGLLCSDDIWAGSPDNIVASFNRCDRGDVYVDHHVLFFMKKDVAGLNHIAFEVQDIDDVHIGHRHLKRRNQYEQLWGVGRHLTAAQVFDYWGDPWGRPHEHWTDSDRLNAAAGGNLVPREQALGSQWGEDSPEVFRNRVCP
jgi:catechol 2,3-dioxygenase-like lactoylglutathione lyase family enzyme